MSGISTTKLSGFPKDLSTYQKGFHNKHAVKSMKYSTFGKTGLKVSLLGFGGAPLGLCHETPEEQDGIETVIEAVKNGVNYIDTAPYYSFGKAEIVLGKALKHIPRQTYYLATKVGRYGPDTENQFDFSAERTMKSVEESLFRLGIDYIDVLQVHDIEFAPDINIVINETLPVLQKLKDVGKIKYIGITGYPISLLQEVLEKSTVNIDMVLSYCRCTLFDNTLRNFIPGFKKRDLGIINAAALGMGLLTNNGPPDRHPAVPEIKETCKQAAEYCKIQNVDISKLAAYYSFSQPDINIHLIGMQNKNLLKANISSLIEGLTFHEEIVMQQIQEKYFENLSVTHWENIEVERYWAELKRQNKN